MGVRFPPVSDEVRFENRMSDTDALMWAIEKDPMLRSTITTVVLLDGEVPREQVRRVHSIPFAFHRNNATRNQ